jgi:hypothetical protein
MIYSGLWSIIPKGYVDTHDEHSNKTEHKTPDDRNPAPLMVSTALWGDDGPHVYNKSNEGKHKQNTIPRADLNNQIFCRK